MYPKTSTNGGTSTKTSIPVQATIVMILPPPPSPTNNLIPSRLACGSDIGKAQYSPDGALLATQSAYDIYICDLQTMTLQHVLKASNGTYTNMMWSPDGTLVASGTTEGLLQIWEANTGAQKTALKVSSKFVGDITWSPNGKRLATTDGFGKIREWDFATRKELLTIEDPNGYGFVAWSPNGIWLAGGCPCGISTVWNASTGNHVSYLLSGNPRGSVGSLAWSPDGTRIAHSVSDIQIYDPITGKMLVDIPGNNGTIEVLAWSTDSKWLAGGLLAGSIHIWDSTTGQEEVVLATLGEVTSISWSPDSTHIIGVSGASGEVLMWATDQLLKH